MNHYYFIPVTHSTIQHDGVTLLEHLSMVDSELYQRSVCGIEERVSSDVLHGYEEITRKKFSEKLIPRELIVVQNENGQFYELASCEVIQMTQIDTFCEKEVLGSEVADYFYFHPEYVPSVLHFFDTYYDKKREQKMEKPKSEPSKKKKFFFRGKTTK